MIVKLLVVDDRAEICDFVDIHFSDKGIKVLSALTGEKALEIFKSEKPEIVLLDIKMPGGMDGMEVLKRMKAINRKSRIIMITAVKDAKSIREAERLGAEKYITKKVNPVVWDETIMKMVEEIQGEQK